MSERYAIIELRCAGVSNLVIIKQLKVPKSTVYNTVARFKELGDDKDHPRSVCLAQLVHPRSSRQLVRGWHQQDGAYFRIFGARKCGPLLYLI